MMLGHFFDQRNRRRKGALLRARVIAASVPSAAGVIFILPGMGLLAPVSFANKTGDANLSLPDASGQISATAAISEGESQSIGFEAIGGDGVRIPYTLTLTGAPVPGKLTFNQPAHSGLITLFLRRW